MSQSQDSEAVEPQFENAYYVARVRPAEAAWMSWAGVGLAGVAYGMTLVASTVVITGIFGAFTMSNIETYASLLLGASIGILVAAVAGFLIAIVAALFVIPTVSVFNYTIGNYWSPITTAGVAGSLCGFVPTAYLYSAALVGTDSYIWLIIAFLIGPVAAMVFGQVGATRSAVLYIKEQLVATAKISPDPILDTPQSKPIQFGIKQLLVLTAWFAGASAIGSFVYQEAPELVIVSMTYLILGPATFPVGKLVTRKWIQRELVRKARIPVGESSFPSNENTPSKPPPNPFED